MIYIGFMWIIAFLSNVIRQFERIYSLEGFMEDENTFKKVKQFFSKGGFFGWFLEFLGAPLFTVIALTANREAVLLDIYTELSKTFPDNVEELTEWYEAMLDEAD